jgi:transposase-like protein
MNHDPAIAAVRRQLGSPEDSHSKRTYPAAAKRSAAQLARSRRRNGHSITSTARALGLHPVVLGSWVRAIDGCGPAPFAPVVHSDAPPTQSTALFAVVHPASGLRIEGLSIPQLTELLRGLR